MELQQSRGSPAFHKALREARVARKDPVPLRAIVPSFALAESPSRCTSVDLFSCAAGSGIAQQYLPMSRLENASGYIVVADPPVPPWGPAGAPFRARRAARVPPPRRPAATRSRSKRGQGTLCAKGQSQGELRGHHRSALRRVRTDRDGEDRRSCHSTRSAAMRR